MCDFDQETCWYSHATESSEDIDEVGNDCNQCGKVFKTKSDLMKHIKAEHKMKVAKCRNFLQGSCDLDEMSCWFIHDDEEQMVDDNNSLSNGKESNNGEEQVFQEAKEKTPPDHISRIMSLIMKLSIQVDKLEQNARNCHQEQE